MGQFIDLTNKIFGRLTVISLVEKKNKKDRTTFLCKCECGNEKEINASKLRSGHTKSCGCLLREINILKSHKLYENNRKYSPDISTAKDVFRHGYNDGNLTFDQFYELSQKNCYYCNISPSNLSNSAKISKLSSQFAKDSGDFIYNGLDRFNSNLPHNIENVVSCCKICNIAKRAMTVKEFKNHIKKLYEILLIRNVNVKI